MRRAVVFGERPGDGWRAGRTLRSARLAGFEPLDKAGHPEAEALEAIRDLGDSVLLMRAGSWLARRRVASPAPSASGRPLLALGACLAAPSAGLSEGPATAAACEWRAALERTGGDFDEALALPPVVCALLDAPVVRALRRGSAGRLEQALAAAAAATRARVVRYAPLDCFRDDGLRVAELVTSLQQGGAERIAVDLARALPQQAVAARLFALGAPQRATLAAPADCLDFSRFRLRSRAELWRRLRRELVGFGADVAHAHLLSRSAVARLAARWRVPTVATVHNTRQAWPRGLRRLRAGETTLLVACARAVERQLVAACLPVPTRTVWNGIDVSRFAQTPERERAARDLRQSWGFSAADFVLLCVANARPQKRLALLAPILAEARRALAERGREVRLVLAGAPGPAGSPATHTLAELCSAVERLGLSEHVRLLGSVADMPALYRSADALVAPSAHEGLSLAQLEALASGLPVLATRVGGTREAGRANPALQLFSKDAAPREYASRLLGVLGAPRPPGRGAVERDFSLGAMTQGYARLLRAAVGCARRPAGDGLLLVTNNFSTGGAQSSARRLLLGLREQGVRVRAAVIEEQPELPTPGRRALEEACVPVLVLGPPERQEPSAAVARLLDAVDADPPAAVLLWNTIPEHKLLLADGLLGVPVFDVSPGEMYFESLRRYFASPRRGLPYRRASDYGARLEGVIVKYAAEAARAGALGAPVHVIPNGVPLPACPAPRRFSPPPGGRVVLGTLARLSPRKRLDLLLAALRRAGSRMPPCVVRIAGEEERASRGYRDELLRLAEGLPVEFVGEPDDVSTFLGSLDAFVLVAEPAGCPNASLEAMAAGLPVVATDAGGMSEQVEDGVSGLLVGGRDVAGLGQALVKVTREPELRRCLGAAGRTRVAARFSLARMVAAYRALCLDPARSAQADEPDA